MLQEHMLTLNIHGNPQQQLPFDDAQPTTAHDICDSMHFKQLQQ